MKTNLLKALTSLPESLQCHVLPIISKPDFKGVIHAGDVDLLQLHSALETPELLLSLLPLAAAYSVAPISNFNVGAIARAGSGNLYFGANYEFINQALFNSVHAEQAAINNAFSHHESAILDVTVTDSPCGHCRQFMNELHCAPTLSVNLKATGVKSLATLLPDSFGPIDLGISESLLAAQPVNLSLQQENDSSLVQAALQAANTSYAPYSHCHAGIALETTTGIVITGRYIENAAFNPSLSPLQSVLINLNLAGYALTDIAALILVEKAETKMSHAQATQVLVSEMGIEHYQHEYAN
ncbi:cytidine deaminase [Moritella sp. F3]|uniref:cytidine deaminase n=1 Tax=Moritella sp. F3 TaxID=2718882 RepID=UPI0018E18F63|nr:cytidine deaminase [Moritella sp. F3]GIC78671.1 cytidine deaminase [Moritella sp. F1]GIC81401.1 cytidine deaminase [Moritella sp. F3]